MDELVAAAILNSDGRRPSEGQRWRFNTLIDAVTDAARTMDLIEGGLTHQLSPMSAGHLKRIQLRYDDYFLAERMAGLSVDGHASLTDHTS